MTSIICPFCKHSQDNETMYSHTTFWGEENKFQLTCEHCSEEFWCEEYVKREFETSKTEEGVEE